MLLEHQVPKYSLLLVLLLALIHQLGIPKHILRTIDATLVLLLLGYVAGRIHGAGETDLYRRRWKRFVAAFSRWVTDIKSGSQLRKLDGPAGKVILFTSNAVTALISLGFIALAYVLYDGEWGDGDLVGIVFSVLLFTGIAFLAIDQGRAARARSRRPKHQPTT